MRRVTLLLLLAAPFWFFAPRGSAAAEPTHWDLHFGAEAPPGSAAVKPGSAFSPQTGYGVEVGAALQGIPRGGAAKLRDAFVTSETPFHFPVAVPEGVYRVTVVL